VSDHDPRDAGRDPYLELTDEAAHDHAVAARREARSRRQVAAASATWVGTLRDLAEQPDVALVLTAAGHLHRGALTAVADDHVVLRLATGGLVLLRLDRIRAVRPEPGRPAPPAMGDRTGTHDRTLADALDRLAADGARCALLVDGVREPLQGQLVTVGEDVLTLRLEGTDQGTAYAPIDGVAEILLDG
jgi:hypothetical protein